MVQACGGACYPKKLEPIFPPELDGSGPLMKRVCKASHVPAPTTRIRKARKATEAKAKKAKKGGERNPAEHVVEPAVAEVQETAHRPASREDIQRSIEIQNAEERCREEWAKEDMERLKILFRDHQEFIKKELFPLAAKPALQLGLLRLLFKYSVYLLLASIGSAFCLFGVSNTTANSLLANLSFFSIYGFAISFFILGAYVIISGLSILLEKEASFPLEKTFKLVLHALERRAKVSEKRKED